MLMMSYHMDEDVFNVCIYPFHTLRISAGVKQGELIDWLNYRLCRPPLVE